MRQKGNARASSHYDGTSKGARRKKFARSDLNKIFYKNETTFKFKKYVTKIKRIINVLGKHGVPLYEWQMVDILLDQIMSSNTELKKEVNIFRLSHSSIFFKAYTYLSTVVARIYPYDNPSSSRFRKRSIYAAGRGYPGGGIVGRFNDRVSGRGSVGRDGRGRGVHVQ